eukprot:Em0004g122a
MELSEDEQGDYDAAKQKMIKRMVLASFVSMDGFLKRRLRLEEALSLYIFELKWLLDQAMPGLDATAHSPLLLHQFMEGLPTVVSRQLRAAGDVKDLDTALERVRTLMTLEEGSTTVAAMEEKPREETQVQKLAHQITLLTEQVAALSVVTIAAIESKVQCDINGEARQSNSEHLAGFGFFNLIGSPIRVPSRHIPEQYRSEVEEQIKSMLQQDESQHKEHLNIVFQKLQGALRGKKCHIGMDKVFYLDTPFNWTTECDAAFQTLKQNLVQAPVLAYPRFDQDAAAMTNTPIGRPWKMIAVDVLEVLRSVNNNIYFLVIQDYFTKWVETIPLPDQTTNKITTEIIGLFQCMEYQIFCTQTKVPISKVPYFNRHWKHLESTNVVLQLNHPQCDGMVERVNRSLLQLLRAYVEKDYEWERVIYHWCSNRTAVHTSTGVSPFVLMFGREPRSSDLSPRIAFDTNSYQRYLQAKLAELQDFAKANTIQAGAAQKTTFDSDAKLRLLKVTLFGCQFQNLRQCDEVPPKDHPTIDVWNAPQIECIITSPDLPRQDLPREDLPEEQRRYPTRQRRQPDRISQMVTNGMAVVYGSIGEYTEGTEEWPQYVERILDIFFCIVHSICFKEQFFEANGINDVSKIRSIFLSAIGPKAYQLLASLIALKKPGVKTYAKLKEVRTVCSINHSEDIYQEKTNSHYEWSYMYTLNVTPVLIR